MQSSKLNWSCLLLLAVAVAVPGKSPSIELPSWRCLAFSMWVSEYLLEKGNTPFRITILNSKAVLEYFLHTHIQLAIGKLSPVLAAIRAQQNRYNIIILKLFKLLPYSSSVLKSYKYESVLFTGTRTHSHSIDKSIGE